MRKTDLTNLNEAYQHVHEDAIDMDPIHQLTINLPNMSIREIAQVVIKTWPKINYAAKPYVKAMLELEKISDNYMFDSGHSVVAYFLSNASSYRGEAAKIIKMELKRRLENA